MKNKLSEKVRESCIKYLIRCTTRCTPYGLCAGVSNGLFGSNTNICLNKYKKNKKYARPDMAWLFGVIKKIELDKDILKELNIRFNNRCYMKGNRIILPRDIRKEPDNSIVSIRCSKQILFVYNQAQEFISYNSLRDKIGKLNQIKELEVIDKFLLDLIENEFLITELRPPLINTNVLDYLYATIMNIESARYWMEKLGVLYIIMWFYHLQSGI